jgi:murein DD-endopeptidase MepM/ murein hydrolase activator NlpD
MAMMLVGFSLLFGIMVAIVRMVQIDNAAYFSVPGSGISLQTAAAPAVAAAPAQKSTPQGPIISPTPDAPRLLPTLRTQVEQYVVKPGDALGQIARQYGVSLQLLVQANNLTNPDLLEVGQVLTIPVPTPEAPGSDFKIVPDSELVYGPSTAEFDINNFIQEHGGYLASYTEVIDEAQTSGVPLSGAQVVERVAQEYSVNPRLLLAVLEYESGWVTQSKPREGTLEYPMGVRDRWRKGLYRQLAFVANQLNRGYYLWRVNGVGAWLLSDGKLVPIAPTLNAGSAGVQNLFSSLYDHAAWRKAVSPEGVYATYFAFYGDPFQYTVRNLLPPGLKQPALQLPFEAGNTWSYTGGPHGGWGDGSAWAALDFAPPGDALGCVQSNAWVVAVADGAVVRTGNGAVLQELDGDGLEQTGWVILYMHIESRDRVEPGVQLKAGDRVGHPSCEGGVSNGTHVHLARKYNGEWIPADGSLAFILDGWTSLGSGREYDGYLKKGVQTLEAYAGRSEINQIAR